MGADTNLATPQRAYAALRDRDTATLSQVIAEDAQVHVAGSSPISGDYVGREAVLGMFGSLAERSGGTFSVEIHDLLASDDRVVALLRVSGQREGRDDLDARAAHVIHVEGETVTELFSLPFDAAAFDAFWA